MKSALNLARRPFVNEGPVLRLAGVLWLAALVLVGVDAWLYVRHSLGTRANREQQQRVRERIGEESRRISEIRQRLSALDLEWQNTQAGFVNRRIDERAFSWSELFDRLEEVLPGEARLTSLAPDFQPRERQENPDAPIRLQLRGEARSGEGILALVDRLFEHAAFTRPDLQQEVTREGVVGFGLEVLYRLPRAAAEEARAAPAAAEGADPGATPEAEPPGEPEPADPEPAAAAEEAE